MRKVAIIIAVSMFLSSCSQNSTPESSSSTTAAFPDIERKPAQSSVESGVDSETASRIEAQENIYEKSDGTISEDTVTEQPKKAIAYLNIPGTAVNDWVMWAADNNYFLRKDNNENYDFYGCFYMDQDSRVDPLSKNVIIYGHNMDDNPQGRKFAQLMHYTDIDWINKNQNILFKTPSGVQVYKVISVMYTDHNFNYIIAHPSEQNMKDMIAEYKSRSMYITDAPFSEGDKYITLSTCTYKYGKREDQRFLVIGRLLRSNETVETLYNFTSNPSPKEPQWDAELFPLPDNVVTSSGDDLVEAQTENYASSK